jgi:hypothetical protein
MPSGIPFKLSALLSSSVFVCFVQFAQQTAIPSPNNINQLIFQQRNITRDLKCCWRFSKSSVLWCCVTLYLPAAEGIYLLKYQEITNNTVSHFSPSIQIHGHIKQLQHLMKLPFCMLILTLQIFYTHNFCLLVFNKCTIHQYRMGINYVQLFPVKWL